jgi:hypothetical protein
MNSLGKTMRSREKAAPSPLGVQAALSSGAPMFTPKRFVENRCARSEDVSMSAIETSADWKHVLVVFKDDNFDDLDGRHPIAQAFRTRTDELFARLTKKLADMGVEEHLRAPGQATAVGSVDALATQRAISVIERDPSVAAVVVD